MNESHKIDKKSEDPKGESISRREQKQIKKAFKELDKLERDKFMQELVKKDQEKTDKKKVGSIVESNEFEGMSMDELKSMVPALRKQSRQAYLKLRDEQIMDLYKRNIDEEKRVFGDAEELSNEEKRIAELKQMLFGLASKFKQKSNENEKVYQFPD